MSSLPGSLRGAENDREAGWTSAEIETLFALSFFYGGKLFTTGNPEAARDRALLEKLGIRPA